MTRPYSIVQFERFYLAALVIGLVNSALNWGVVQAQFASNPAAQPFGPGVFVALVGLGILIPLLLWYFVAHRASVVAKWILVLLFVLGAAALGRSIVAGNFPGGLRGILGAATLVLQAVAVWVLFRPDTKPWFAHASGEVPPADTAA